MSRNLMLSRNESALIVIDHQDACLTPRFYDLASLLNDSFFPSARREMDLLGPVLRDAETAAAYRRCAVQRTLKACATFIRFADRGYTRYLRLVAPTLGRAALHFERIAEGAGIPESVFARWRNPAVISAGLERITSRSKPHARAPLGSP